MYRIFLTLLALSSFLLADWNASPIAVNASDNPGTWNVHYIAGFRKIARIGNTVVLVCPYSSGERLYRSTNNGASWTQIDDNLTRTGCIISGADSTFYYFFHISSTIYMVKFYKDNSPPTPTAIYSNSAVSTTATGTYRCMSAAVDSTGKIYVAAHWGSSDQIYVLSSTNGGENWYGPYQVSVSGTTWSMPAIEVTPNNLLIAVYQNYSNSYPTFAKSSDGGLNWTRTQIVAALRANPTPLCLGDSIYVFAQNGTNATVWHVSADEGATWSSAGVVNTTCGYGDPTAALGSDKTIYVAFRSSDGSGLPPSTCGNMSKFRLAQSTNYGSTWTYPDDGYDLAERCCERSHIRYQTWFNYGGPLEWMWGQYTLSGTQYVIYYDINTDVTIFQQSEETPPAAEKSTFKIKILDITD